MYLRMYVCTRRVCLGPTLVKDSKKIKIKKLVLYHK